MLNAILMFSVMLLIAYSAYDQGRKRVDSDLPHAQAIGRFQIVLGSVMFLMILLGLCGALSSG